MTTNPIDELDIAIKPNSLKVGKKYIIAFRAIRPNGVYGELRNTVIVNSPPIGGKVCFICFQFSYNFKPVAIASR